MPTFLAQVADHILQSEVYLGDCVIVIPNQRAKRFLNKELEKRINSASLLPEIFSIEEWIQSVTKYTDIDSISLFFDFYEVVQEKRKKKESFAQFLKWAPSILQDFNDLDLSLVSKSSFFSYLSEVKKIEEWTENQAPTAFMNNFVHFWSELEGFYDGLKQKLLKKNQLYQGLNFRIAAEKINEYSPNETLFFVGLNALSKAEETIISHCVEKLNAKFLWTADQLYLQKHHQAGRFIRKYNDKYQSKKFNHISNNFEEKKDIHILGASRLVGQAMLAGQVIKESDTLEIERTAIVLADEGLLIPVLHALPKNVEAVNVTMGYPIANESWVLFFQSWIKVVRDSDREKRTSPVFYLNSILTLFQFSSFLSFCRAFGFEKKVTIFRNKYKQNHQIRISNAELISELPELYGLFSEKNRNPNDLIAQALSSINQALDKPKKFTKLENQTALKLKNIFTKLKFYATNKSYLDLDDLLVLFRNLINNERINFFGEPISGLQIMGLLETRLLSYDTVILLSANEGILPNQSNTLSFIPFGIRRVFGLPTHQDRDSLFAYQFYELIARAKQSYIIYNTESKRMGSSEKSRFIVQLEKELKNEQVVCSMVYPKIFLDDLSKIKKEKSQAIIKEIHSYLEKGISPSSLNLYIRNPIDFYNKKILKIPEQTVKEEGIPMNVFGIVLHKTLEELYTPFIDQTLTGAQLKEIRKKHKSILNFHFKKEYDQGEIQKGKNHLLYHAAESYLHHFFDYEQKMIKNHRVIICELEQKISRDLELKSIEKTVRLYGEIDRIDEIDGTTRLVDYKSGSGQWTLNLKKGHFPKDLSELISYDKIIQLLFYSYLYLKNHSIHSVTSGIIPLPKIKKGFMPFSIQGNEQIDVSCFDLFEGLIEQFSSELLNSAIPFESP